MLQQCLPFTVLKLWLGYVCYNTYRVATVLTVYGIETKAIMVNILLFKIMLQQCLPFTVLKLSISVGDRTDISVATVLTVYGIETNCLLLQR